MCKKIVLFDTSECPHRVRYLDARNHKTGFFCSKFTGSDVTIKCETKEFPEDCPLEDD